MKLFGGKEQAEPMPKLKAVDAEIILGLAAVLLDEAVAKEDEGVKEETILGEARANAEAEGLRRAATLVEGLVTKDEVRSLIPKRSVTP